MSPATINLIGYVAAACTTFAFIPQAIKALRERDTHSLSLGMYVIFTGGILLWEVYGWVKQDWALIVANACTGLLSSTILAAKIHNDLFGARRLNPAMDLSASDRRPRN